MQDMSVSDISVIPDELKDLLKKKRAIQEGYRAHVERALDDEATKEDVAAVSLWEKNLRMINSVIKEEYSKLDEEEQRERDVQ